MGTKVFVKNIHSGSRKAPPPYSFWIDYWRGKNSTDISKCPRCGNYFQEGKIHGKIHGGHVKKVNDPADNSWYIIPLCEHCNELKDENPFLVDENLLVPVNQQNISQSSAQTQSANTVGNSDNLDNSLKLKSVNEMLAELLDGNSR